ncbi:MAG: 50S ribosomal protein L37ae [Candidatus Nanoarchaeia archaeon]
MAKKSVGLAKTYGTRYGKKIRDQVGTIESEARRKHKCPYCNYVRVKRVSAGVWECGKCNKKFTGRAYTAGKKIANPYAMVSEDIQTYKGELEAK